MVQTHKPRRALIFVVFVAAIAALAAVVLGGSLGARLGFAALVVIIAIGGAVGAIFPAVDRATRALLEFWINTGLCLLITTLPIALFHALSRWMLDRLPLSYQVAVLVAWGLLLSGAIWLIGTAENRIRLYRTLGRIGALAPLIYTFNVLWIATVFFALATCLLAGQDANSIILPKADGSSTAGIAKPQERFSYLLDFFLWHFLDEIPLLNVNKTLQWEEPLKYHGWVGPVLLLFKVAVTGPAIAAFAFYWQHRRPGIIDARGE